MACSWWFMCINEIYVVKRRDEPGRGKSGRDNSRPDRTQQREKPSPDPSIYCSIKMQASPLCSIMHKVITCLVRSLCYWILSPYFLSHTCIQEITHYLCQLLEKASGFGFGASDFRYLRGGIPSWCCCSFLASATQFACQGNYTMASHRTVDFSCCLETMLLSWAKLKEKQKPTNKQQHRKG